MVPDGIGITLADPGFFFLKKEIKKKWEYFKYPKGYNEIADNRWVMANASLCLQQAFNKNNEAVSYVRS